MCVDDHSPKLAPGSDETPPTYRPVGQQTSERRSTMYQEYVNEARAAQYQQQCLREAATERSLRAPGDTEPEGAAAGARGRFAGQAPASRERSTTMRRKQWL